MPSLNIKASSSTSSLDSVSGYNVPLEQDQVIDTSELESMNIIGFLSGFNINDDEFNHKDESTESELQSNEPESMRIIRFLSGFNISDDEINHNHKKESSESELAENFLSGFNFQSNESIKSLEKEKKRENSFGFLSGYNFDEHNTSYSIYEQEMKSSGLNISSDISDYNTMFDRSKSTSDENDFKSFQGVCRVIDSYVENNNDINLYTVDVMTDQNDEAETIHINQNNAKNQPSGIE